MGMREILISVLVMTLIVLVFSSFLNDTSTTYGSNYDNTTWQNDFVNVSEITSITDAQSKSLEESGTQTTDFEPNVGSATATAKLVLQTKSILAKMVNSLAGFLGVGELYVTIVLGIFGVIIFASIMTFLWRSRF